MELEDSTYSVVCGELTGLLLLENFSSRRECVSCEHGLVKPATFERLAGKGHCKSWKRTVRCAETGKDIASLIEAGTLQLIDEPQWIIKRREANKISKAIINGSGVDAPPKRKRGRPRKSESGSNIKNTSILNQGQEALSHTSGGSLPKKDTEDSSIDQIKLNGKAENGHVRKRRKLKGCNDSSKIAKMNKSKAKENGFVNGFSPQMNGFQLPGASLEVYKRVPRHGKCKRKRVRHNDFERSVNAIIRDQKSPALSLRLVCPICNAKVQDADALKCHDLMFHSSVSRKVFLEPEDVETAGDSVTDEAMSGVDSMFGYSESSFFELGSPENEPAKESLCLPTLDVFKDKLTRGTVAKLTSLGVESALKSSPECPSSSKDSANVDSAQLSLLSSIAVQYQEILGISKDALQQTTSLRERMEVLAKSVEDLKADVKDLSKTIALANMAKSAVRDDITAGDYQTFFNILEKFLNSNGHGVGR